MTTSTTMLEPLVREMHAAEEAASRVSFPCSKYARAPRDFCEDVLNFAPTGKQIEVMEAVVEHDRVALPSGRKTGKSRTFAALALWHFTVHKDATVCLVAPCERQITEIVYFDMTGLFHGSGRCLACSVRDPDGPRPCAHSTCVDGELSASVRTGLRQGQRRIIGLSPRDAERARGISGPNQLWLIDESSGVTRAIYNAADGNRAGGAKLVVAGQPTSRMTWFFDACEKLDFHTIRLASTDSPNVKLGRKVVPGLADSPWIEEKLRDWGNEDDPRFMIEVRGLFPSREGHRLASDDELAACNRRHEEVTDLATVLGALYFGIDPAGGTGGDKSAIVVRRGGHVLETLALNADVDAIALAFDGLLLKYRRGHEHVIVNYDASSHFGREMRDALKVRQDADHAIQARPLEMKGNPDHFVLAECRAGRLVDAYYLNLQVRLKTDAAIPFDETLDEELRFAEFRDDQEDGKSRLISKRAYRKQLGRSPDVSDALAFAFWEGRVAVYSSASKAARDMADEPYASNERSAHDVYASDAGRGRAMDPYNTRGWRR